MKKLSVLLAIALLLGLAACGVAPEAPNAPEATDPPETQAVATTESTATAPESPGDDSDQLYFDVFRPAFELAGAFSMGTMAGDAEQSVRRNGVYYYRVTDPRFTSFAAMEATLCEIFSEELTRRLMVNSPFKYPLYIEHGGEIYAVGGRGFPMAAPMSFGVEEQSGSKITYRVRIAYMDGREKDFLYIRELVGGKWIFTEFPMEWMTIAGAANLPR